MGAVVDDWCWLQEYHPVDGGSKVTLRRMGKGSVVALLSAGYAVRVPVY